MNDIPQQLRKLETDIAELKLKQKKDDKAVGWSASWIRRMGQIVVFYAIVALAYYQLNVSDFLIKAIVPTVAMAIGWLILYLVQRWWERQ